MKVDFEHSSMHNGKLLVSTKEILHGYSHKCLWSKPLTFEIRSGDRIHLKGDNGSGKTTLVKIILGEIQPLKGEINTFEYSTIYIDQDYSLIDNTLSVYEQSLKYNFDSLPEHEIKIRLNRFLFHSEFWDKPSSALSGGEKMRLILCCLMISNNSPDMFILDEPTNNLDIKNIDILTSSIKEHKGSLIVISHDTYFLKEIGISRTIDLNDYI
jgi:ATPase subunit of ABC transporter with duplicated ATPase domains